MKSPSEIAREIVAKLPNQYAANCVPVAEGIIIEAITAERQRQEEITKAFSKSDLHDFYQWEIDKHSVEYEVEFRGIEIKELREKQERLVEKVRDVWKIQMNEPSSKEDSYMRGMANGLELAMSILEDMRQPNYIEKPNKS